MQIVIDISDKAYDYAKTQMALFLDVNKEILDAVKNGVQISKGHGKIGDIDELHNTFKNACDAYNINNLAFISDVDMNFDLAPTIIEADKESKDADND